MRTLVVAENVVTENAIQHQEVVVKNYPVDSFLFIESLPAYPTLRWVGATKGVGGEN